MTPRELAQRGQRYARKDTEGISHWTYMNSDVTDCFGVGRFPKLVYHESNSVTNYPTCLWCVAWES